MPLPRKIPQKTKTGGSKSKSKSKSKQTEKRVLANRYTVHKRLGSGNFGTAWIIVDGKAKEEKDKLKALKEIPVGDLQPDETIEAVHEASLLRNLDHPSIVKFHDSFIDGTFFCIVTEFCEGGDLDQKIAETRKKHRLIPEAQVIEWLIQLLLALQYMHDRRVLHRDLKARNIFLRNNVIKVGDFGISRILMGTAEMASTFVGTPYYMSPEVLKHEGYNSKSDVWSIGCILYEMCALRHAFEGQSLMGVMYKIVEGNLPEWPDNYSQDLKAVFENLLIKVPTKRPSAADALKLHFIAMQMELLKNTMMDKHHQKEQKDHVRSDSERLWDEMKRDTKIDQLRRESEEQKWKNMSPRERMRFKKQQVADEDAKRLRVVALQQQIDNKMKYDEIRRNNDPYETHFDFKGTIQEVERKKGPAFTDYRTLEYSVRRHSDDRDAPEEIDEEEEEDTDSADDDADGELAGTVVENKPAPRHPSHTTPAQPQKQASGHQRNLSHTEKLFPQARTYGEFSHTFHQGDDRPITPMKDKMVYDVEHSSLDFNDGVPDSPELADTYYSQFEDFEKDDEEGAGEEIEEEEEEDAEGTLVAAAEEDVADLINCLQNALDKSDTLKSQTLTENSSTSAFGPVAREMKIKNLKLEAISKMGEEDFNRAYSYLKEAYYGDKNSSKKTAESMTNQTCIMGGLAKIVRNTDDCFAVEQLLFLEAQAEMSQ